MCFKPLLWGKKKQKKVKKKRRGPLQRDKSNVRNTKPDNIASACWDF